MRRSGETGISDLFFRMISAWINNLQFRDMRNITTTPSRDPGNVSVNIHLRNAGRPSPGEAFRSQCRSQRDIRVTIGNLTSQFESDAFRGKR